MSYHISDGLDPVIGRLEELKVTWLSSSPQNVFLMTIIIPVALDSHHSYFLYFLCQDPIAEDLHIMEPNKSWIQSEILVVKPCHPGCLINMLIGMMSSCFHVSTIPVFLSVCLYVCLYLLFQLNIARYIYFLLDISSTQAGVFMFQRGHC